MNIALYVQIFSFIVVKGALILLFPSLWRLFIPRKRLKPLDPIRVSLWFLSLCMLNSVYVRASNNTATLFTYHGGIDWPLASFLVHVCLLTTIIVVVFTERALLRAREP